MLQENPLDFLDTDEFAVEATFLVSPANFTVPVLFDESGAIASFGADFGAEGRDLRITTATEYVESINHHDQLIIATQKYEVSGISPVDDGFFTELTLQELEIRAELTFGGIGVG